MNLDKEKKKICPNPFIIDLFLLTLNLSMMGHFHLEKRTA